MLFSARLRGSRALAKILFYTVAANPSNKICTPEIKFDVHCFRRPYLKYILSRMCYRKYEKERRLAFRNLNSPSPMSWAKPWVGLDPLICSKPFHFPLSFSVPSHSVSSRNILFTNQLSGNLAAFRSGGEKIVVVRVDMTIGRLWTEEQWGTGR